MVQIATSNSAKPSEVPTTLYDCHFAKIDGLTWLPWVGAKVPTLPQKNKLLIVGESHYSNETNPSEVATHVASLIANTNYTRDIIQECPVNQEWRNPTLENIERFLLGGQAVNRVGLWSDLAFYNFVQRPMEYALRKERPAWDDWAAGWTVFQSVVNVLRPSHCIFIGVAAANAFEWTMNNSTASFQPISRVVKIRRTWARSAQLTLKGQTIGLSFTAATK